MNKKCKLCGKKFPRLEQFYYGKCGVCYLGGRKDGDIIQDPVNPEHYTNTSMELIDAFEGVFTREEFIGACKFNVIKYTKRFDTKNGVEDLEKAAWYLKRLTTYMEENDE